MWSGLKPKLMHSTYIYISFHIWAKSNIYPKINVMFTTKYMHKYIIILYRIEFMQAHAYIFLNGPYASNATYLNLSLLVYS